MLVQVMYKVQQDAWQALSAAAREIDETHALLLVHHQRIPTVDTVQSLSFSTSHVKHSLTLRRRMTAVSCKTVHICIWSPCPMGCPPLQVLKDDIKEGLDDFATALKAAEQILLDQQ